MRKTLEADSAGIFRRPSSPEVAPTAFSLGATIAIPTIAPKKVISRYGYDYASANLPYAPDPQDDCSAGGTRPCNCKSAALSQQIVEQGLCTSSKRVSIKGVGATGPGGESLFPWPGKQFRTIQDIQAANLNPCEVLLLPTCPECAAGTTLTRTGEQGYCAKPVVIVQQHGGPQPPSTIYAPQPPSTIYASQPPSTIYMPKPPVVTTEPPKKTTTPEPPKKEEAASGGSFFTGAWWILLLAAAGGGYYLYTQSSKKPAGKK